MPARREPPQRRTWHGRDSRRWSSTEQRSPATRSAATGSPPAPCACSRTWDWRPRRCRPGRPHGTAGSARRRGARRGSACPRTASTRRSPPVATSTSHSWSSHDPPVPRCSTAMRSSAPPRTGSASPPRSPASARSGPTGRSAPTGCGHRCASSSVHRRRSTAGEWHAFRQYVGGVGPLAAADLYVSFEADLVPGYFWSFPLPDGRANIGFGIQRGGTHAVRDMGRLWADLLERPHVRAVLGPDVSPLEPHRAWPIPARVDGVQPATERALFVGDAVAACDVLTGEGIAQALVTGRRAAESIVEAGPGGRRGLGVPARAPQRARGRPPHVVPAGPGPEHARRRLARRRHRRDQRLDTTQLRPLALRGLPPCTDRDPASLATWRAQPARRLRQLLSAGSGPTMRGCRPD